MTISRIFLPLLLPLGLAACQQHPREQSPHQGLPELLRSKVGDAESIRSFRVLTAPGGADYVLVLTDPLEKTLQNLPKLRIFQGRDLREVYAREGFFLDLSGETGRDINRDGVPEVVIHVNNGGNCLGCSRLEILSLPKAQIQTLYESGASALEDLDGDGVDEIVRTYYALGSADWTLSHVDQITDSEILAWTGDGYSSRNSGYEAFWAARIESLQKEGQRTTASRNRQFSLAARILLTRLKIAECREAWEEFWRNSPEVDSDEGLRKLARELESKYRCP